MMLFSVMGIPPLAGFFGKWEVIQAANAGGVMYLAICLILASVISAFYYLRIIKTIWFDAPRVGMMATGPSTALTLTGATVMLAALTLIIGLVGSAATIAGAGFAP
jgi:NADH-quinone oxidoreductase subunit N